MYTTKTALWENYKKNAGHDEILDSQKNIKPEWSKLMNSFDNLGFEKLKFAQSEINSQIQENGVTFNMFDDPSGLNRPWQLNAIPYTIHQNEWAFFEKGLQQRAKLMDLIYKDIYGERLLIKNGIIPMEIIYGHRGFLRSCDGLVDNSKTQISLYASDFIRDYNGNLQIVNDRTQTPTGMGYALENRTIASSLLSDVYSENNVKQLHPFFEDVNQLFINAKTNFNEATNIVVLSPGARSETYFEHAFIASYYGYNLVQGKDLAVRDGFVWLKTLKGLERVDVIYRRVSDDFMDPLELNGNSLLGVVGILEAVRKKNVVIINPIGSGVLENSGIYHFLPAISQFLLNEPLLIPQLNTWWCGNTTDQDYVLKNITSLVVKRIDHTKRSHIHFGAYLSATEIEKLKAKIKLEPKMYVGQQWIHFRTVPNFIKNIIEPRYMSSRAFAVAKENSFSVMPGGLVRVSSSNKINSKVIIKKEGISKDFCVVDNFTQPIKKSLKHSLKKDIIFSSSNIKNLPSSTAENVYWAGRYVGRILVTARFVRVLLKEINSASSIEEFKKNPKFDKLLDTLVELTGNYKGYFITEETTSYDTYKCKLVATIFDNEKPNSLLSNLYYFKNAYLSIRNLWSSDMWKVFESINKTIDDLALIGANQQCVKQSTKDMDKLITSVIAFMGLIEGSVLIEQGLLFYYIGLRLEISELIITKFKIFLKGDTDEDTEYELLGNLLESQESSHIYRYTYRSVITPNNLLQLILFNQEYARSLCYLFSKLETDLNRLPIHENMINNFELTNAISISKQTILNHANNTQLLNSFKETGDRTYFLNLLEDLSATLENTASVLVQVYFNHLKPQSQVLSQNLTDL